MKGIIVDGEVIDINDIESMEVTPKKSLMQGNLVRITFTAGGFVDVIHDNPEQFIEEHFTSQK